MVAMGGGAILAAASANTILQTIVDDRLRGRVAGFYTLAFLGVAPLGNLAAGALAARWSAPAAFAINGVGAALAALWFWRKLPEIRARCCVSRTKSWASSRSINDAGGMHQSMRAM